MPFPTADHTATCLSSSACPNWVSTTPSSGPTKTSSTRGTKAQVGTDCKIPFVAKQKNTTFRLFFQHFRKNSAGRKLPKFQKLRQNFCQNSNFLLKLANFCLKLSFPAKLSNFYYIRVLEKLTDLVKTQPNFKTQPKISPKLSFPATPVAVHAAQSLKKAKC